MQRRGFITGTGITATAALAGCTAIVGASGSPEEITEEYAEVFWGLYLNEEDVTYEDFFDEMEGIAHSVLLEEERENTPEEEEWTNRAGADIEVASTETEMIDEDIDEDTVAEEFSVDPDDAPDELMDDIADENAVVELEVEFEGEDASDEAETDFVLTTVEDGTIRDSWRIVYLTSRYDT